MGNTYHPQAAGDNPTVLEAKIMKAFDLINLTVVAATILYSAPALANTTKSICPSTEDYYPEGLQIEEVYGKLFPTERAAKTACQLGSSPSNFLQLKEECEKAQCVFDFLPAWKIGLAPNSKQWEISSCYMTITCMPE